MKRTFTAHDMEYDYLIESDIECDGDIWFASWWSERRCTMQRYYFDDQPDMDELRDAIARYEGLRDVRER